MGGQILRTEKISPLAEVERPAVDDHFVRQPASLSALPAIGAAAAERFARETLSGIGDAQRPVNEDLDWHVGRRRHFANVVEREFAGQHDALDAKFTHIGDAARLGQRHLRGSVDVQSGYEALDQPNQADVLHDHRVDAVLGDRFYILDNGGEFIGEDQRVERNEALHVAIVQKSDDSRQFVRPEIGGAMPGIELRQTEVNRIGPIRRRGA